MSAVYNCTSDAPARPELGLVLKIETRRAVRHLPEIIVQAASHLPTAVMIARGDLAVEVGYERLTEIQEEILWLCEAAHVVFSVVLVAQGRSKASAMRSSSHVAALRVQPAPS